MFRRKLDYKPSYHKVVTGYAKGCEVIPGQSKKLRELVERFAPSTIQPSPLAGKFPIIDENFDTVNLSALEDYTDITRMLKRNKDIKDSASALYERMSKPAVSEERKPATNEPTPSAEPAKQE